MKALKVIGGFLVIALLFGAGIYFFAGSKSNNAAPLASSTGVTANAGSVRSSNDPVDSDQFLDLLLNMSSIKLDDTLFSMQSFRSLRDYSTVLSKDVATGRPNPFAPIGQDSQGNVQSGYSVTTANPAQVTATTALLGAILPAGVVPAERWFEWGPSETVPLQNQTPKVQQNLTSGTYVYQLSGLTPNTVYYVRAAARIGSTQFFGDVVPFQTASQTIGAH